ncbi:glycogen/starch/alpha-glucan phosphorylase [Bacillus sp. RG28]|uniref:Alpha-1,4 glucan phosphorylase n=1 Tax=Gottfriedia endophytica TaxID=2820819 RepID=A0A940NQ64_9BACI|nr:glycogen/starch/alpha-glucan phosphorylase [Gottfriedia endophytica]MBP0726269.1 glycogen/starch/alpha-glucan phosphorylase [Gottfriedia endophytica]
MFSSVDEFVRSYKEKLEHMHGKQLAECNSREQYETLGTMVREYCSRDWLATMEKYRYEKQKQVYYLSIEFLLGKLLKSNLIHLGIRELCEEGLKRLGISLTGLEEVECDAGLGNGGLGRLAACFLDSLASQDLPGHGCGIRYKHGLFDQRIVDGYQVELPEQWLKYGNVWEVRRDDQIVQVTFGGEVETYYSKDRLEFRLNGAETISAVPYDLPIIGYRTNTINSLRLWSAEPSSHSPNRSLMKYKIETEAVSEFLYPDDTHIDGKILRLKQQYFLVSASIQRILASYKEQNSSLLELPDQVAIHINDTHPVLAIPEMMRILIDEEKLDWDTAWDITTKTISYTNHTTLSEALEKWQIDLFKPLLPRIYLIVEEINERYCAKLWEKYPGDWQRIEQMAIIAHGVVKMAHLAIVGSHSVNGVAEMHTDILKKREMRLFYEYEPNKFNNKTNGITHRRWLLQCNPELTSLINYSIGDAWIKDPTKLVELLNWKEDRVFLNDFADVKRKRKTILANYIHYKNGISIDHSSIFDIQVKRMHAYKRQLLNVLHIMYLYNRLKEDSRFEIHPRTFIFGAKASPGYYYAKKIIKLIHSVAEIVNNDPYVKNFIKVIFIENFRVSLGEIIYPAADVSEQISTASKEASGTGNMKFMMNGAITLGTLDGANIEILNEVGEENLFIFGLTAEEVLSYYQNGGYKSSDYYHHDTRIKKVLDQLIGDYFPLPSVEFEPIYDSLMSYNDEYFLLRDFSSYVDAHERLNNAYLDKTKWSKMSVHNVAKSGYFTSDRTIRQYAEDIWNIEQHTLHHS